MLGLRALVKAVLVAALCLGQATSPGHATPPAPSDITVREVTKALFLAGPGEAVDFSGRALRYLDLSAVDSKGARLASTDLYGVDLTGAILRGADLRGVRLDRANIAKADFSGADLTGATLLRPKAVLTPAFDVRDAPRFGGAQLGGIRVKARLDGADFRGADLTRAGFSPLEKRPSEHDAAAHSRNHLVACDFSGAILHHADLTLAILTHARFLGADLKGANLSRTDLSNADFTGANVSGVDLTGADLDGTRLAGAIGLDRAVGLGAVLNTDKHVP